jgi:hypothetical protein
MGRPRIDVTGQRFGRLVVTALAGINKHGEARWSCTCDCGNASVVGGHKLRSGQTVSCGCFARSRASATKRKHGYHGSPTYASWLSMKGRCLRPTDPSYAEYGGRGITVHAPWIDSFELFLAEVGERPPGTTLDRIDNDRGYEPGNVRWSTAKEQANNRRAPRPRGRLLESHEPAQIRWLIGEGMSRENVASFFSISPKYVQELLRKVKPFERLAGDAS